MNRSGMAGTRVSYEREGGPGKESSLEMVELLHGTVYLTSSRESFSKLIWISRTSTRRI